jgi:hypothetical protein
MRKKYKLILIEMRETLGTIEKHISVALDRSRGLEPLERTRLQEAARIISQFKINVFIKYNVKLERRRNV